VEESRWEHALHETKGLGNWRRDIPLLVGVMALTFAGLTVLGSAGAGTNAVTALLVGFGVLVLLPLFELLRNYARAPRAPAEAPVEAPFEEPTETPAETPVAEEGPAAEEDRADREEERYRALSERLGGGRPGPQEDSHSE
jgi:hypothetical protein